jgi:hypothetical protein
MFSHKLMNGIQRQAIMAHGNDPYRRTLRGAQLLSTLPIFFQRSKTGIYRCSLVVAHSRESYATTQSESGSFPPALSSTTHLLSNRAPTTYAPLCRARGRADRAAPRGIASRLGLRRRSRESTPPHARRARRRRDGCGVSSRSPQNRIHTEVFTILDIPV